MVFDKTYLLKETGTACWDLGTEYKRNHKYKIVLIFFKDFVFTLHYKILFVVLKVTFPDSVK